LKIDVLGLAETHWIGNGKEVTEEGWEIYYSGGQKRYAGVGLLIRPGIKEVVTISYRCINQPQQPRKRK